MGDIADEHVDQMIDRMIENGTRGFACRRKATSYGPPVACNRCGASAVFWQRTPAGYELWDIATHEKHECPTSADGFGDCDA